MRSARRSVLPVSSLLLVTAAAVAVMVDAARAQDVPVTYGTDPAAPEGPQILSFRAEDAPAPTGDVYHTVQAGETVYALARAYGVPPAGIINANGLVAPFGLQIGQQVLVPMAPQTQEPSAAQMVRAEPTARASTPSSYYLVAPGDTLFSLSRRFELSVAELSAANRLSHPYSLSVGQRLVIPGRAEGTGFRSAAAAPAPEAMDVRAAPSTRALTA
ncbi:MAG: LysM peptidoglycan-binding domain-containing protein, partial [Parvularcula sp.]|nr:LysM peptidoglycan-binding domain-containing protein [Parvularcula sp.]